MDLNLYQSYNEIDETGIYELIISLPEQLQAAYTLADSYPVPESGEIRQIILVGMGGSAIAGDLCISAYADELSVPIYIHRDYYLPAWVKGKECLVILSSHSGNTEEVISAFECGMVRNCSLLVITTGGRLGQLAEKNNIPIWKFTHNGPPRTAVGWSFGMLTRLFERMGYLPNQHENITRSVSEMQVSIENIKVEIPVALNPAKRLAGQLMSKYITVFAAEHLSAVARRWKTQINELAKCVCQFETLPEVDHNSIAGTINPEGLLPGMFSIFLQSQYYNPRNNMRMELTFTEFMVAGIGTDLMNLRGESAVSEMWKAIIFGDLVAYYLAILYDIDPTPIEAIESLKTQLA